jgi:glycosyltransferase involved in cell wall biosynthesis
MTNGFKRHPDRISPPAIPPVRVPGERPFWSVMIPTYNPNPRYLTETVASVLDQKLGPGEMQIQVVDDCSPKGEVEDVVKRTGHGRVAFVRNERNLGLAQCWNRCLTEARGLWVHILHQDDLVMPDFYTALRQGCESNDAVGTAFCRHATIDAKGNRMGVSVLERAEPGPMANWNKRICEYNGVLTPCVVVRRSVYESLGGFRNELVFTLDWEMWQRISTRFAAWYEPRVLACYREHSGSETPRLVKAGEDISDLKRCMKVCRNYLPKSDVARLNRLTKNRLSARFLRQAEALRSAGVRSGSLRRILAALEFNPSVEVISKSARILARMVVR